MTEFVLPAAFERRMRDMLGNEEAEALFATYTEGKAQGLRVNPLKVPDAGQLAGMVPFRLTPVPWCATGFYYDSADAPGKHPYHAAGVYYIQEPSAMYAAESLGAQPGERVLDLCAAPGGKTTHIGGAMGGRGLLVANEYEPKRAKALSENVERLGLTNAVVLNETPERLASVFPGFFDRVMVDAPCSGEGMFRKDPDAIAHWSEAHVLACARLQAGILDAAYAMLREGGVLAYSTCTFSPEENERSIAAFLQRHPDVTVLPLPLEHGVAGGVPAWASPPQDSAARAALSATARLWPHRLRGEGHYVALLRKGAETPAWRGRVGAGAFAGKQQLALYREFEKKALNVTLGGGEGGGTFALLGTQLYLLPEGTPDLSGLRVVRSGLHLGELKKDRFEPNHALALALPAESFAHRIEVGGADDRLANAYLRGETFPGESGGDRGWLAVTYDGFPLGWGKESKGTVKNFYPKGLRRLGV
ncbi:RsmF rRNA methyltransferase first C-terminal domain-containing protein [Paenibacillus thermotolerans]|uniref:RsmF rRNA methyltransferase first C-terminal domain-containing protein n=1 Tax=Paenibacillus thermotolerans TaxID=3027807 RepID=UPI002367ABFE|nr:MULTISPECIES: RsmB/NOP family class I SAM-dependent RNA methyltransferase [unclassified Paenibacillus]